MVAFLSRKLEHSELHGLVLRRKEWQHRALASAESEAFEDQRRPTAILQTARSTSLAAIMQCLLRYTTEIDW